MGLRDLIRELLSDSGMQPSARVFPDIDASRITRDLQLEQKGKSRGSQGQPGFDSETFDSVELRIVDHIETLRKGGIDQYEEMRRVYATRLERAREVRQAIITAAQTARGDLLSEATKHRTSMASALGKVTDSLRYQSHFREANGLKRPYLSEKGGWPNLFLIASIAIVVEVLLNGVMFAEADPGGILGGITVAFIISVTNVAVATMLGLFSLYINHRRFFPRMGGLLSILLLIVFASIFNLLIGHYRDALQVESRSVLEAGQAAVLALRMEPLGVEDVKSILLIVMGVTISIIAAVKTYTSFDPYPGYSSVYYSVENALENYTTGLSAAIQVLEKKRDHAVTEFREAQATSDRLLSEAADATSGHAALHAQLRNFLESTNTKVNLLLQTYRDANLSSRPAEAGTPRSFSRQHRFTDVDLGTMESAPSAVSMLREERSLIAAETERAVRDVAAIHDAYVRYFPGVDQLSDGWTASSLPDWEETLRRSRAEHYATQRGIAPGADTDITARPETRLQRPTETS